MPQLDIDLPADLYEMINNHLQFGFQDKNGMVETALQKMKNELQQMDLSQSADLYAEMYEQDDELQKITKTVN